MSALRPHQFASVMMRRQVMLAEIEQKVREMQRDSAILATSLRAAVPKRLRRFVREQEVVEVLLKFGACSDRYGYNLPGLQSYKSVARAVEELREAWKDNVIITMDDPGENGRVSIRYFAAPHIY